MKIGIGLYILYTAIASYIIYSDIDPLTNIFTIFIWWFCTSALLSIMFTEKIIKIYDRLRSFNRTSKKEKR